jgi:hypothetical protein
MFHERAALVGRGSRISQSFSQGMRSSMRSGAVTSMGVPSRSLREPRLGTLCELMTRCSIELPAALVTRLALSGASPYQPLLRSRLFLSLEIDESL